MKQMKSDADCELLLQFAQRIPTCMHACAFTALLKFQKFFESLNFSGERHLQ